MSKLSELLNPVPRSNLPTPAHHVRTPSADDGDDSSIVQQSVYVQATPGMHLNSPLDALAAVATSSAPFTSPSQEAGTSFRSSEPHHRNYANPLSRPSSSHFSPPLPSGPQFSPGLEQYHHTSHRDSGPRKLSEIADTTSRELPPLRRSLAEESSSPTMPLLGGQSIDESHKWQDSGDRVEVPAAQMHHSDSIQEPDYVRNAPMTSQIRQPSYSPHPTPPPKNNLKTEILQPEVKTELVEEAPEPVEMTSLHKQEKDTPGKPTAESNLTGVELATSKNISDLRYEESFRASSIATEDSTRTPSVNSKSAPSKKRAAPKSKKGTASAIRPAPKKRKLDSQSVDGTPSLQHSRTPTSSRASKTPAPRNRKVESMTPSRSSSIANFDDTNEGEEDEDMEDDAELFCICRKPDDHTWMIGCDAGCDDWFHGRCVNMNERDGNLVDKYICPNCEEKGNGQTTWKPMCRLQGCRDPARVNDAGAKRSKYCSDAHGEEFMRRHALKGESPAKEKMNGTSSGSNSRKRRRDNFTDNVGNEEDDVMIQQAATLSHGVDGEDDEAYLRGGVLRAAELKTLANGVKDIADFRKLGEGVLSPPRTVSPEDGNVKDGVSFSVDESRLLETIAEKKESLKKRRALLDDRERLLVLVKARAKSLLEDLKKKEGLKDLCGFDARLVWSDEELDHWRQSSEGLKAMDTGVLGPPPPATAATAAADGGLEEGKAEDGEEGEEERGICRKKRCERHKTWWKLQAQDIAFERDGLRGEGRRLEGEEKGVRDRAMIRHLEGAG